MTVLELRFPSGRFHATPWGRHVNEGAVEWPPSPWRILRALVATWHLKAREEIPEETVRALVAALSKPPVFHLPPATTAHTRHYMPYNEGKNEKTTKVFDTFIQLPENEAIRIEWDVDLPMRETEAMRVLSARLGYFGRAESIVEALLVDDGPTIAANSKPLPEDAEVAHGQELVRLLLAMSPDDYGSWRSDFVSKSETSTIGKKRPSKKQTTEPLIPIDHFAALHADTGDLQAAGWNLPPGARYVNYTRPENAFASAPKPRRPRHVSLPTVARFALSSVVPPSLTKALAVGEQIHTVLCEKSNGHPLFTGAGSSEHRHAHILCESIGNTLGHITHVTIFAAGGFDEAATMALRTILWTWGFKRQELRLVLQGIGQPNEFADCNLFSSARTWRSFTPFVSTRHAKTFRDGRPKIDESGWQVGSEGHDLLRLLAVHPHGSGAEIKQVSEREAPYRAGERRFRSLQFQTIRHNGNGSRGHHHGAAFTITFLKPRQGPFALGYGAHFGLGLFVPAGCEG